MLNSIILEYKYYCPLVFLTIYPPLYLVFQKYKSCDKILKNL
jgi:hypothetical protein